MSEDGCGWCSSDDGCGGLDDGGGGHGSSVVRRCGDYRALDGHFVGVGVAGGDRHCVGDSEWCGGDERRRMNRWCSQETWCRFRCWSGQGTGEESEKSDEFVHGCKGSCVVARSRDSEKLRAITAEIAESRMMLDKSSCCPFIPPS